MSQLMRILLLAALVGTTACATDAEPTGGLDGQGDASAPSDSKTTAAATCPEGTVALRFTVDDRANQTYGAGELIWTGSFAYDASTNTLDYATSWLPEEGPYPTLYDDGPRSAGGHEPADAVAEDHIFSTEVCYRANEDRLIAYGVLNDDLRWIWIGPNGQIEIPAGATEPMDVPGMALPSFGTLDFRVSLELDALHPDFATVDLAKYRVFIKGTMNSWTPVQLLDDGEGPDEVAGDGRLTYTHSLALGPHDGLLSPGQEAQFVFVFAQEGIDPDDALEYKVDGDAVIDGVSARGACEEGWNDLDVTVALDSKGKTYNTAVVMCGGSVAPPCSNEDPCPEGTICVAGECITPSGASPELYLVVPNYGPGSGGTAVKLIGEHFSPDATVTFAGEPAQIVTVSPEEISVVSPPGALGTVDIRVTTAGGEAFFPGGFLYTDSQGPGLISKVQPSSASPIGGTQIALTGTAFTDDCVLTVDGESVPFEVSSGTLGNFLAPPHPPGVALLNLSCGDASGSADLVYAGAWDGQLDEWGPTLQLSTNTEDSDWGPENRLEALYATTDGVNLYVAVAGQAQGGEFGANAILVYIDADYGESTGLTDTGVLESDGALDNALGGVLLLTVPGFGAELGFGTLNGASTTPDAMDPAAGWRAFDPVDDIPWLLTGVVVASPGGVEATLPLTDLFGPPAGLARKIGLVVVLGNHDGAALSNQRLPANMGHAAELTFTY